MLHGGAPPPETTMRGIAAALGQEQLQVPGATPEAGVQGKSPVLEQTIPLLFQ